MKSERIFVSSLLLALLGISVLAQTGGSPELPKTSAGKRVEAYIKAFNSHDEKLFASFVNENLSTEASRSIEERLTAYRQMYNDLGRLELHRVNVATQERLVAQMRGANGPTVEITFQFEADEPHKIKGAVVELGEMADNRQAGGPTKGRL